MDALGINPQYFKHKTWSILVSGRQTKVAGKTDMAEIFSPNNIWALLLLEGKIHSGSYMDLHWWG